MRYGFIGKMRAGKDTCAEYLIKQYGGRVLKFADPLYEMEAAIYKIMRRPIPGEKEKRRLLLQWLGTDFARNTISQNIWADILESRVKEAGADNLFISDCRFPNETIVLKRNDFKLIQIIRSDEARFAAGASHVGHASETSLDDFDDYDHIIHNEGSFDDLYQQLDAIAQRAK